jgi:hypothetical protein
MFLLNSKAANHYSTALNVCIISIVPRKKLRIESLDSRNFMVILIVAIRIGISRILSM